MLIIFSLPLLSHGLMHFVTLLLWRGSCVCMRTWSGEVWSSRWRIWTLSRPSTLHIGWVWSLILYLFNDPLRICLVTTQQRIKRAHICIPLSLHLFFTTFSVVCLCLRLVEHSRKRISWDGRRHSRYTSIPAASSLPCPRSEHFTARPAWWGARLRLPRAGTTT